ncbi:MFS transporter [Streptomonospora litoralis]|uniref:Inner membrane transport protein YdhP n=1 Tax=Streptomonospora litoralis TaxID=2498135 RepID=A0A4P6PWE3_9ACTN|nr:MFS transporter [Streptomonospora litoralis]QBI51950.1 Inner membrane transport protein YdhP [Streptomonospora litoralis]
MPRSVAIMALGVFAMVTSEFLVAGLMPQLAAGLGVTIPQIGYLITAFAAAMAVGGPVLTVALLRIPPKRALMILFGVFLAGNLMAALSPGYGVMLAARIVTGAAAQAFIGTSLSLAARLTGPEQRARAAAVVMTGLMTGTLLGLPLATWVGGLWGWRAAFWGVALLTLGAVAVTAAGVPSLERAEHSGGLRGELTAFANRRLWLALSTSTLIIGATFAAFSYFNPILTRLSGFSVDSVPLLLVAYGAATLVGNYAVGRLADRHTITTLSAGLMLNAVFLTGFALLAQSQVWAVAAMMGIGLVGVTMNPAMITRVQRAANAGPLVNTVHASFITLGVIIGSSGGGLALAATDLRGPLWFGVVLALIGLATLLPEVRHLRPRHETTAPVSPVPEPEETERRLPQT